MKSFSQTVRQAVEPLVRCFPMASLEDKAAVVALLELCYSSMVTSEPLLRLCAERAGTHQEYFKAHLAEEHGHDVWMKRDIEFLGGTTQKEPFPEIITLCGEQYYLVQHVSPLTLLGYMAVIEGFPLSAEVVRRLRDLYGEGIQTLAYHAENDVEHSRVLAEALDQVPITRRQLILQNAVRTAELYGDAQWRALVSVGIKRGEK